MFTMVTPLLLRMMITTCLHCRGVTNIVFSNGQLDPWSVFGVLEDVSDTVVAVIIPDGAHHLDLMYSRPDDSNELRAARQTIMRHVLQWIEGRPVPSVRTAASGAADGTAGSAATGVASAEAARSSGSGKLRVGYASVQHTRFEQLLPAGAAAA
jgi:lysosomal Pro-X carboxypeptidase